MSDEQTPEVPEGFTMRPVPDDLHDWLMSRNSAICGDTHGWVVGTEEYQAAQPAYRPKPGEWFEWNPKRLKRPVGPSDACLYLGERANVELVVCCDSGVVELQHFNDWDGVVMRPLSERPDWAEGKTIEQLLSEGASPDAEQDNG